MRNYVLLTISPYRSVLQFALLVLLSLESCVKPQLNITLLEGQYGQINSDSVYTEAYITNGQTFTRDSELGFNSQNMNSYLKGDSLYYYRYSLKDTFVLAFPVIERSDSSFRFLEILDKDTTEYITFKMKTTYPRLDSYNIGDNRSLYSKGYWKRREKLLRKYEDLFK